MAFKSETVTVGTTATAVEPAAAADGDVNWEFTFTVPSTPAVYAGGSGVTAAANKKQLTAGAEVSGTSRDGTLYLVVASGTVDIDVLFSGV